MSEEQVLLLFKCLADRSRLRIVQSLLREDMYVELLSQRLGLTPATISFHLKKLEEAWTNYQVYSNDELNYLDDEPVLKNPLTRKEYE